MAARPPRLSEHDMFYTYVLMSKIDNKLYVGYATDLKKRESEYNDGKVISTRNRRPFKLIYYEACENKMDAIMREKYFKTGFGRRFLENRLENALQARDGGRGHEKQKVVIKKIRGGLQIKDWKK